MLGKRSRDQDKSRTLFVGNISYHSTTEALKSLFSEAGDVAHIQHQPEKGYAFVTYEDAVCARSALDNMQQTKFDGRVLTVERRGVRKQRASSSSSAPAEEMMSLEQVMETLRGLRECHLGAVRSHVATLPQRTVARLLQWQRQHLTLGSEESCAESRAPTGEEVREVARVLAGLPVPPPRCCRPAAAPTDVNQVIRNFRLARGPCHRRKARKPRLNLYQRRQLQRKRRRVVST